MFLTGARSMQKNVNLPITSIYSFGRAGSIPINMKLTEISMIGLNGIDF